ncbi:hypothetical protein VN97_g12400 [Penicillium thymicola]|uniref:Hydrophobin n=1 Tax=Penicillium thymicola TaxID=293382 RepID=A0AAI9T6A6_PENTH|nr:hypothetical protein VN97_g12400 [Penicillium thymicola]
MKATTISTFLALAISVAAMQSPKANMATAEAQCTTGDLACCDSKETLSGDGILGNLLAKGALNGLLGNDDSACAKTSVLGDVNVLAESGDSDSGPVCKNIIACCPKGTGKVDNDLPMRSEQVQQLIMIEPASATKPDWEMVIVCIVCLQRSSYRNPSGSLSASLSLLPIFAFLVLTHSFNR